MIHLEVNSVDKMIDLSVMTRPDTSNVSKQYAGVGVLYVRPLNTLTSPRARPRLDEATFVDGG